MIFAGITLFPVNSVKALKIQYVPINPQEYPGNDQTFPCGCIAIARALQNQGDTRQNATARVQTSITTNARGCALDQCLIVKLELQKLQSQ